MRVEAEQAALAENSDEPPPTDEEIAQLDPPQQFWGRQPVHLDRPASIRNWWSDQ